ncbi:hypothetical protein [Bowdeniella nasicola]|uniref:hypothetical protein n=1 Tax=Bowdeniella nasicola TaxID=208480 RepID=UPI0011611F7A|nr:hypothetical protein [Bowdeniella nasicola]
MDTHPAEPDAPSTLEQLYALYGVVPGEPFPLDLLTDLAAAYAAGFATTFKTRTKAHHLQALRAHERILTTAQAASPLAIAKADAVGATRAEGKTIQDELSELRRIPADASQRVVFSSRDIAEYPTIIAAAGRAEISFDNAAIALSTIRRVRPLISDDEASVLVDGLIDAAQTPLPEDFKRRCNAIVFSLDEAAKKDHEAYNRAQRARSKADRGIRMAIRGKNPAWGMDLFGHLDEADIATLHPAWLKRAERIRRARQATGAPALPISIRLVMALHDAFGTGGPALPNDGPSNNGGPNDGPGPNDDPTPDDDDATDDTPPSHDGAPPRDVDFPGQSPCPAARRTSRPPRPDTPEHHESKLDIPELNEPTPESRTPDTPKPEHPRGTNASQTFPSHTSPIRTPRMRNPSGPRAPSPAARNASPRSTQSRARPPPNAADRSVHQPPTAKAPP